MRVFVAGASGAIGRPLVAQLLERGHAVTGLTRSEDRAARLRAQGAAAVVGDVYDAARLADAMRAAEPDVVVHQLTALPPRIDPRKLARDLAATNRVRTEGTDLLLDAARAAGARRFVAQSVAFAYASTPSGLAAEDAPCIAPRAKAARAIVDAIAHLERAVAAAPFQGVVLRYGFFYGPGTVYARDGGSAFEDVSRRRFPIVGRGRGRFSFVHVDDAARATVLAVEGDATGTFNVVEDDPAPAAEWLPRYAGAIGAKPPLRVPRWLGRLVAGEYAVHLLDGMPGAVNARAREVLGWAPARRWSDEPVLG